MPSLGIGLGLGSSIHNIVNGLGFTVLEPYTRIKLSNKGSRIPYEKIYECRVYKL